MIPTRHITLKSPDSKTNPSKVVNMDNIENWVDNFIKYSFFEKIDTKNAYKEIKRNFNSKITHGGLIHYLHLCWAQEKGCELRPDMIFYTIISEMASEILKNPENYVDLFTGETTKTDLVILTLDEFLKADTIIDAMRNVIKSPELLSTVCDIKFDSDVKDAGYARNMVFACMGTPYYNYLMTMCGIPHIELVGSFDDWQTLHTNVKKLSTFTYHVNKMKKYFENVINVIENIIKYGFSDQNNNIFSNITNSLLHGITNIVYDNSANHIYNNCEHFFNNIFHYGKNTKCGSGHPDYIVNGWAKLFYLCGNDTETDLSYFSSHVNFVPYRNIDTGKYYCEAVTLAYSDYDESRNTLKPQYGIVTYEVIDENIFNRISNPKRTDNNGREYQPLSFKQLKEIVDNGTLYDPAKNHYQRETIVICDRCRQDINVCIGYSKNYDLCLECVQYVKNHQLYNQ
jgi:hypothetical protein